MELVEEEIGLQRTEVENRKKELDDLERARITRAWDLLHKAREQAAKRMDAAEQQARDSGDRKLLDALNALQACQAENPVGGSGSECTTEQYELAEQRWRVREPARGGNDGQIGAIHTLATAGVDLNGLVVNELYLQSLELPNQPLASASFRFANLERANLTNASLWGANFSGANLWDASLSGTDLRRADLRNALLVNVNLSGADLDGTRFSLCPKSLGAYWMHEFPPKNLDKIIVGARSIPCE